MTATDKKPRRGRQRGPAPKGGPLRLVGRCGIAFAGLAALCLVAVAGLYLKLATGPIGLGAYSTRVETALAARLGPGWRVSVQDTALELLGLKPAIRTSGLEIRNSVGITVVRAPYAVVSLNPLALLVGDVSPREIELRGLHLRGVVAQDGSLSFSTPVDTPAVAPPPLPAGDGSGTIPPTQLAADEKPPSVVSAAASSLLRPLVSPSGVIGGLDRAKLVDARLTLVGADGRERAAFDGVDAAIEKDEHGDPRIKIEHSGPKRARRVAGRVIGAKGHATTIEAHGVAVADLLLLGGLSNVPVTSDIKFDGSLAAFFAKDRLARLEARLAGSRGSIARKQGAPLRLDGASAEIAWDEPTGSLALSSFRLRSEGTQIDLQGRLAADDRGGWRLSVDGRDLTVADLDPGRPPFRLASLDAGARLADGRLELERLAVRGDGLTLDMAGSFAPGSSGEVFSGDLQATNSDARKLVRIWPDFLNPPLRAYFAARLIGGTVEALHMRTSLDPTDFKAVFTDDPMSDRSIEFTFATTGIGLNVVDGLPPLANLAVQGRTTGHTATMTAAGGSIDMPDGRKLAFTDATYSHPSLDKPGTPARIGFRVRGGFDALASFLQSPLIREAGVPELDPAGVRGAVDVRATLPLVPGSIPPLAQLGIELTGTLSDVSADKLPARERLEAGQFAILQDASGFGIKGEAKLSGSPATFDLRVPRTGPGELTISAMLDDAARTRRSLPVAPALSGPVGVKVSVPLGAKAVPRVEADLSRAAIDGLIPGWQKPAGKPGRIAFTVGEGSATELRDFSVDSGSVQMRGNVVLSAAGGLDRAEFSSFRMSPGDEMRTQLDRVGSGYRVALRGNNADARPLLKWLNAAQGRASGKDGQDTDIDVAVAILSGFNDEAMTGVTAKASSRGGELRSLQFGGKFRGAAVEATLAKRDAGAPVLSVRSWDAGATLRFLDLYRRMNGGRLALEGRVGEGVQQGQITIDDFGLRDEPALRRIVAQSQQGPGGQQDDRGPAPVSRQDADQVLFTRLTTSFRRAGTRMDYTDAVIYGTQVGFNLSGWVDTARDRLDVNGTFVPAYLVNNAFSQLPVVGLILGGGRTEGLIAVDFRVAGALSGPTVTVNPLTVVAPGILRKLFGWMMPEGQAEPAADARVAPRRRAR